MNIYLDIDGTLLHKDGTPANYLQEFLEYVINNHEVYWLTTHCRGGENQAVDHMMMGRNLSKKVVSLLEKIKPLDWYAFKTEAIDVSKDFIWLDDYLMESEIKILENHGVAHKAVGINLKENPNELKDIIEWLKDEQHAFRGTN